MTLIYRNPLSLLLIHQTARNPGACCPAGSSSGGHMVIRIRGRRWQYLPKSFLPEPVFATEGRLVTVLRAPRQTIRHGTGCGRQNLLGIRMKGVSLPRFPPRWLPIGENQALQGYKHKAPAKKS